MSDNRLMCGCELGGDCTKTTLCQAQDALEGADIYIKDLEATLRTLANHNCQLIRTNKILIGTVVVYSFALFVVSFWLM